MNSSIFSPIDSPCSSFSIESSLGYEEYPLSPLSYYTEPSSPFSFASLGGLAQQLCSSSIGSVSSTSASSSNSSPFALESPSSPPFEDLMNDLYPSSDDERLVTPTLSSRQPLSAENVPFLQQREQTTPAFVLNKMNRVKPSRPMSSSAKSNGTISLAALQPAPLSLGLESHSFSQVVDLGTSSWEDKQSESMLDVYTSFECLESSLLSSTSETTPTVQYATPVRAAHRTRSNPALQSTNFAGRQRLPAKASLSTLREDSNFDFSSVFDGTSGASVAGSSSTAAQPSMFAVLGGYGGENQSLGHSWESRTVGMDAYRSDYTLRCLDLENLDISMLASSDGEDIKETTRPSSATLYSGPVDFSPLSPPHISDLPALLPPPIPKKSKRRPKKAVVVSGADATPIATASNSASTSSTEPEDVDVARRRIEASRPIMICGWHDPGSLISESVFETSLSSPVPPAPTTIKAPMIPARNAARKLKAVAMAAVTPVSSSPFSTSSPESFGSDSMSCSSLPSSPITTLQKPIKLRPALSGRAGSSGSSPSRPKTSAITSIGKREQTGPVAYSFINYTVNDATKLMTGVAPSGNARKACGSVSSSTTTVAPGSAKRKRLETDEEDGPQRGGKRRA
ncbi:hypothetical protein [Phaffia rhodozyma]|uniref:Uncharacterized protein n=1 Tax=Phaffia rhodozyma TaxID=264483 RepID=A0A0F7SH18_PHARH|nr:hypothetical protein [Phaffia rhodozyma]